MQIAHFTALKSQFYYIKFSGIPNRSIKKHYPTSGDIIFDQSAHNIFIHCQPLVVFSYSFGVL